MGDGSVRRYWEAPGETWRSVGDALRHGRRGLRKAISLPELLARHRGRRHAHNLPPLSKKKILAWADAHHQRTGRWPSQKSGAVVGAPGEKWDLINNAL